MDCVYFKNCFVSVSFNVENVGSCVSYSYYPFSYLNSIILSISNKEKNISMCIIKS